MWIGVNWTYPQTYPIIRQLREAGLIDFCEISLDNFIHLPVEKMQKVLYDLPVGFHILSSRFLEKTDQELQPLANKIASWIKAIKPLYVSDHLARVTYQNKLLPLSLELNYQHAQDHITSRVSQWQDLLGCQVFFENFPSLPCLLTDVEIRSGGAFQPQFFSHLIQETGAGLLFDFSNAYIAQANEVCHTRQWNTLVHDAMHFHAGGFRMVGAPPLAVDTHDVPVSGDVIQWIEKIGNELSHQCERTLVIEFDKNMSFDVWKDQILSIRRSLSK